MKSSLIKKLYSREEQNDDDGGEDSDNDKSVGGANDNTNDHCPIK